MREYPITLEHQPYAQNYRDVLEATRTAGRVLVEMDVIDDEVEVAADADRDGGVVEDTVGLWGDIGIEAVERAGFG